MIELELPWPPSVNTYWRHGRGITYISDQGKLYRKNVILLVREQIGPHEPMEGLLKMSVQLFPPDRRIRDIDNILKCLFDSLTHAGVYKDDNQIKRLEVEMTDRIENAVEVYIDYYQRPKREDSSIGV